MQPASPLPTVEYAERSDPGRDPEKQVNEDACGHRETRFGHLCVVCDGMGLSLIHISLALLEHADAIAHAMLRETTSLGVRRYDVSREELPRRIEHVETPYGRVPVKVAEGPFGPPSAKPEFDACLAAARAHGVPVRQVLSEALLAFGRLHHR